MTKSSFGAATSADLALAPKLAVGWTRDTVLEGARRIQVSGGVHFNGQELADGTYHLSWKQNGDGVEVRLYLGSRPVAAATGRLVEPEDVSFYDSVVYVPNKLGKLELVEVRFADSLWAISLKDSPASQ